MREFVERLRYYRNIYVSERFQKSSVIILFLFQDLDCRPARNSKDMEDLVTQRFTEIRSAYDELLSYFDEPG